MRFLIVFLLRLSLFAQVYGTVGISASWYLDGVLGSDSNNCTSAATACATVAHLLTKTITTGQIVGVACNGYQYREQFLFPAANVQLVGYGNCASVVGSLTGGSTTLTLASTAPSWFGVGTVIYGAGLPAPVTISSGSGTSWVMSTAAVYTETSQAYANYPLFDASNVAGATWTATGGQANVWQISVSTTASGGTAYYLSVWENGIELADAGSLANCNSTAGTFWSGGSNQTGDPGILYVHPTGSGNPNSNGKTYEYPARPSGVISYLGGTSENGTQVAFVSTRRNQQNNGSLVLGYAGAAKHVLAIEGAKHSVYNLGTVYLYDVQGIRAYYAGTPSDIFVLNANAAAGENSIYDTVVGDGQGDTFNSPFLSHVNSSGTWGTIFVLNSTARGGVGGFDFGNSNQVVANNITVGATSGGAGIATNNPWVITSSTIAAVVNVSQNTTITGTTFTGGGFNASGGLLSVSGCTFTGGTLYKTTDAATLSLTNNSYSALGNYFYYFNDSTGITSDYNTFPVTTYPVVLNSINTSLATWKSSTGQDAHSTP